MSRVKLKIFGEWANTARERAKDLQRQVDRWIEDNPHYQILDSDVSMYDNEAIMTVKYYESVKKDLLLEKQIKLQS